MHPEMEPNYSKQRLIFRPKSLLLGWWGGCIPPLNPPLLRWWIFSCSLSFFTLVFWCFNIILVYTVVFVTKVLTLSAFLQICFYSCNAIINFRIWNFKKNLQLILMLRSFSRSSISYARSVMMLVVMTNETSIKATRILRSSLLWVSRVESSRTHFKVFGLGLEANKSSKIALSSAKDSTIFWIIKLLLENARNLAENLRRPFFRSPEKKFDDFFLENTCASVLGPWPRIFLCPWSRALCPRLHLWWLWLHRKNARIRFIT